eukprot:Skav205780  [mRNA]  locus=scaffold1714:813079:816645:- [translate_table: standard]
MNSTAWPNPRSEFLQGQAIFHEAEKDSSRAGGESTDLPSGSLGTNHSAAEHVRGTGKDGAASGLSGLSLGECSPKLLQRLLEVLPLRSKPTGKRNRSSLFPLPTSRDVLLQHLVGTDELELSWLLCVCLSLNSLWGDDVFYNGPVSDIQKICLQKLFLEVKRFCSLPAVVPPLNWGEILTTRTVDYKGDEVRVARHFSWSNISPALPEQVGVVPLEEVCTLGSQHYVRHFDDFIKPKDEWGHIPRPRVMVSDEDWGDVCRGLVDKGVCIFLEEEDVFQTDDGPLLNGMFGVSKEEWTDAGVEIYRLIMNLIPLNNLCAPMTGDVDTLPTWGAMNPYFLQPSENLLISSEDVKCFFYTMAVPVCWTKYLAFNKPVPYHVLPAHLRERTVYIASRVLPMGFLNSVSIAQHVHRNMVLWGSAKAGALGEQPNDPSCELRKDMAFSVGNPSWRVYLDNYDLLEKVTATQMVEVQGGEAPGVLALKGEYTVWNMPRNEKKSVTRATRADVQGACVDGVTGIAFPREVKLAKYLGLGFLLGQLKTATQKHWQIVCGGLVYCAMFRRPLLSGLNRVWTHVESYNSSGTRFLPHPDECQLELARSLGLLPLARLDFRLDMHSMVSCSDASSTGGGVCASVGLTPLGGQVAAGGLRGEIPRPGRELRVLSVSLFDGIGGLRVALDGLGIQVLGHVSVEIQKSAQMVVEANFPGVVRVSSVEEVDSDMVKAWSMQFCQCDLVVLGAGPPCQGVSGLNADRKGALRDARSNLFLHVPRIRSLLRQHFCWCPVHSIMESVASMDKTDRDTMSSYVEDKPLRCDAGGYLWCHRPRLYWCSWEVVDGLGYRLEEWADDVVDLTLEGSQPLSEVIKAGWTKVDLSCSFPTFTTSRPRSNAGRKPAGIGSCSSYELQQWIADQHRFPPYQYKLCNSLVNKSGVYRLPDIEERETMLGFCPGYTAMCAPKGDRKGMAYMDTRLSLVGNSWAVPVVAALLAQLFSRLGWITPLHSQEVLNCFRPLHNEYVQGRLARLPLNPRRGLCSVKPYKLAFRLGNLISLKGEDILLTTPTTQQAKFHRLRASVPARLWKWKIITGWRWVHGKEHINALELKAILTAVRWRLEHQRHVGCRFIHLTDSLVCLHALTRGRSSSRKLRRPLCKVAALLLACNAQPVWGYVHTEQNPADRPSRWGRRVKTKFRHAA